MPKSAYQLFKESVYSEIKRAHPNFNRSEISKLCKIRWVKMSATEQQKYYAKEYTEMKNQYDSQYIDLTRSEIQVIESQYNITIPYKRMVKFREPELTHHEPMIITNDLSVYNVVLCFSRR